uniref:Amino acid transporter transmembrane domain-containing protein n=1 Tax=Mucochytrium quahogii TaxID=96639 RepID=A0A7S2RHZ6_9STRA|mmetsp:Transcript_19394/g.31927  ORF Transcript_19394/g.31927 Transcript_19394/m.31927 type:complete len:467 (+) Transcript_19394:153-1553(+)|eukprot:CAMPEP_0203757524 /NCGR_PEP_ID=MMETSP0098-20131031/10548_1 /ASSEMBLY_ACC=CAM_ASM_000208 /TAXON_ID=96639 /ORGANISM=" , Strain NY0313808BC1" /LENGTH=466 /DNA_ID=CAMNT_0050649743 /DNA_START=124 /DNA_END=1524 /DNA_ORIENTATION=+
MLSHQSLTRVGLDVEAGGEQAEQGPADENQGNLGGVNSGKKMSDHPYEELEERRTSLDSVAPPRRAHWVIVAWLQLGATIGAGVLSIGSAFSEVGWVLGLFFLFLGCSMNVYCGMLLFWARNIVPSGIGIVEMSHQTIGKGWWTVFVSVVLHSYLLFCLGAFVLIMGTTLQEIFVDTALCSPIWSLIASICLLPLIQLRNLNSLRWLLWINLASFYGCIFIVLVIFIQRMPESTAVTHIIRQDMTWVMFFGAMSKVSFAYMVTHVALNFMAEMEKVSEFPKAFLLSTPLQLGTYLFIGVVAYLYLGDNASDLITEYIKGSGGWSIAAAAFLLVHMMISFLIQGNVLSRALHQRVCKRTINCRKFEGKFHWFLCTFTVVAGCYLIANAVPIFDQLISLIGSLQSPFLSYVFPISVYYYAKQGNISFLEKCLFAFILTYAGVLFFVGTAASFVAISETITNAGKPFAC